MPLTETEKAQKRLIKANSYKGTSDGSNPGASDNLLIGGGGTLADQEPVGFKHLKTWGRNYAVLQVRWVGAELFSGVRTTPLSDVVLSKDTSLSPTRLLVRRTPFRKAYVSTHTSQSRKVLDLGEASSSGPGGSRTVRCLSPHIGFASRAVMCSFAVIDPRTAPCRRIY